MQLPEPELHWGEVPETLLALAACDLDDGGQALPRLAAGRGRETLGLVTVRPFETDAILEPMIELLALFLPLGADRVCTALPGRVWSLDEPVPPVCEDEGIDLRQSALVLAEADGHDGPARSRAALFPLVRHDDGEWGWEPPLEPEDVLRTPGLAALATALDEREGLDTDRWEPRAQLDRVRSLGHGVALGPAAVRALQAV